MSSKKYNLPSCPLGYSSTYFFFFGVAFLVAFFALGCFIPHDISSPPRFPFYTIDLFISFKLIFVKTFLMDITVKAAGGEI
jgi:hypothetical protein